MMNSRRDPSLFPGPGRLRNLVFRKIMGTENHLPREAVPPRTPPNSTSWLDTGTHIAFARGTKTDLMPGGQWSMLKRSFDFIVASVGLTFVLPVMAAIAVAVKLDGPGPVFFRQERLGRHGRRFRIYKFRSMVTDAEARGNRFTVGGDARVTRVGRFLRRHKLDELPQLINVFKGEMSLVGPRPEVPEYADLFPAEYARILSVRPGITHTATLRFRNEEDLLAGAADPRKAYLENVMPAKMRLYVESLTRQSLREDIATIVQTVMQVGDTATSEELLLDTPDVVNIADLPRTRREPAPVRQRAAGRMRQTVA